MYLNNFIRNAILSVIVILSVSACGPASSTSSAPASANDEANASKGSGSITDFALKDAYGKTVALSDYLGNKVIMISFWATWCEPCKKEMVQLQQLYEKHKDQDLMVFSISMDEPESQGDVAPYVKSRGYTYPVLIDADGSVTSTYNPKRAAPFSFIIDKNQNIVWEHEGYVRGDEIKIEKAILNALGVSDQ
jgi:peroxiredoxin